jgi:hypothetical protein
MIHLPNPRAVNHETNAAFNDDNITMTSITVAHQITHEIPTMQEENSRSKHNGQLLDDGHVWPKHVTKKSNWKLRLHLRQKYMCIDDHYIKFGN